MTLRINLILQFLLLFVVIPNVFGQKVYLVKNKDTIFIKYGFIGITTATEKFKYKEYKELSYVIEKFNNDTLLIKRPVKYHDTIVTFESYSVPYVGRDYRFKKSFRRNGKLMCILNIIDQYQYDLFEPKKLTSISYPPKSDDQNRCIFCIFVPIYNLFYIHNVRKYSIPKTYNLNEWKLTFETE